MSRNTQGYRHGSRAKFSVAYRKNGRSGSTNVLKKYKKGDIVNIKGNGACQKGLPYIYYHGKTGTVVGVGNKTVQVALKKHVQNRTFKKVLILRSEHVFHNNCKAEFKQRIKQNSEALKAANSAGKRISLKRQAEGPTPASVLSLSNMFDIVPQFI
ncbi:MAG: 60S ribosomal protein L21A [Marteilia pararefringens]